MSKLRKIANFADTKGPGYENSYGQVTPYHILFKDFGNEIASLPKDQAVDFVVNKLRSLNDKYGSDPQYAKLTEEGIKDLKAELLGNQYNNGMDILFAIKDKLLDSEGGGQKPKEEEQTNDDTQQQEVPKQEEQAPAQSAEPAQEVQQEPAQSEPDSAPEAPAAESAPTEQPTQASLLKRLMKKSVR